MAPANRTMCISGLTPAQYKEVAARLRSKAGGVKEGQALGMVASGLDLKDGFGDHAAIKVPAVDERRSVPMRWNPYLALDGRCKEAFEFYERCLGGKIVAMVGY